MCSLAEEHIKHIVAGHTVLAPTGYTSRNNWVAGYIHWTIYINIWGYRLLRIPVNIYLRVLKMSKVPLLCRKFWLSKVEQY
jgi:hypothetical protein